MECRQKAEWFLQGYDTWKVSDYLVFGSTVHYVLEQIGLAKITNGKRVPGAAKLVAEYEKEQLANDQSEMYRMSPESRELVLLKAEVVLEEYLDHYRAEDAAREWVAFEEQFDLDYGGVRIRGKIDAVYEENGCRILMDTKTAGRVNEDHIQDALPMDLQIAGFYPLAAKLMGWKVSHILYNVIRSPQIDPKKNESLSDYGARLRGDIQSRPDFYFMRFKLELSVDDQRKLHNEINEVIHEFTRWQEGKGINTWRNTKVCKNHGMSCPFMKLCSSGDMAGIRQRTKLFEELDSE
jgi:CRISPR/Cas system-associated exonuclease Cas4 (RecB family)